MAEPPKPLEITFHGPFVFHFGLKYAWAYAPRCKEHYLNILTDKEDVALPNDKIIINEPIRTFCLTGPKSGKTVSRSIYKIITCDWYSGEEGKEPGWPDTQEHWKYVLSFPAPDYIFGLVPEPVTIQGYPDASITTDKYARALRFRYNASDDPKFRYNDSDGTQSECDQKNNQIDICAKHLGGTDAGYSIEIRYTHYHGAARKKKEHYEDAQSCFESMRKKLPPCNGWKASFGEDPVTSGTQLTKQVDLNIDVLTSFTGPNGPHDCGAPVMALLDEGVSLEPAEPKN